MTQDRTPEPQQAALDDRLPRIGRREWLLASGTFLLTSCTSSANSTSSAAASAPSVTSRGDDDIARIMRLATVPGMSIATVRGADVSVEGFGLRRGGTEDRVSGDTVFEAASLSKPVFTAIVLQLAAEGVLDLDRPLGEYLALPNPGDERSKSITATHVLSHSGGWRNWRGGRDVTLTSDFPPGSASRIPVRGFSSCNAWSRSSRAAVCRGWHASGCSSR